MERDMDEEMEDTFEGGFQELEIDFDFDYEFDASKYFDLSREESPLETREAESWFINAGSYPPSPFVAKLNLGKDISVENVNASPKSIDAERSDSIASYSDTDMNTNVSEIDESCRGQEGTDNRGFSSLATGKPQHIQSGLQSLTTGLTFYNHMAQDVRHAKTKYASKTSFSRGSTLMKPTASQLAKQNRREVHVSSRFLERSHKSLLQNNRKSLENPMVVSQAAKRQKLEGGHLPKVADTKQQTNFIHKQPQKGRPVDGNTTYNKLKLTIPREPDLETAHRAQRMRPKNSTEPGECVKSTAPMFRARPLNRKILEAPSLPLPKKSTPRLPEFQEFHLKTSERAMQHSSAASSASLHSNKFDKVAQKPKSSSVTQSGTADSTRPNSVDAPKQEGCETIHKFKAWPLNKKIFSSKGDIGVFRNSKREATVPMEFNFSTDKRFQYHPPVELFDKLSLTSQLQQNTASQPKLPRSACIPTKGSKENTVNSFQQEHRIMHVIKEKGQRFGEKQLQCGVDKEIAEIGSRANMRRSLDIR